ncbi:hypothetical protein HOLleu_42070 [Holothuria leucospilota]|uniref:HTH psq-type domain-containing protein n=1 Tax=Holothuria leucospilota TaxID=206669 RepID=A0A9Q0YD81_HOLLE|nr:hypothetical protein HOLleu_42070 [Holothuria leucospilota]
MPRTYKRKTNRGNVSEAVFRRAAADTQLGMSIRSAAFQHNIDRMTLTRFIQKENKDHFGYKSLGKCKQILTDSMEKDLDQHIKDMANQYHGLSVEICVQLAFEFAVKNSVNVPEN